MFVPTRKARGDRASATADFANNFNLVATSAILLRSWLSGVYLNMGAVVAAMVHRFGGDWTSAKLDVLAKYLRAYNTALKDKPTAERPFRKAYIDAFAGTGYRAARRDRDEDATTGTLPFPDHAASASQQLLDGSARLALKVDPRFDRYIFIDRDADRCRELEALKVEFPDLAGDILVERGKANAEIQKICAKDWSAHRAVLFLDPYGMQVEWQTIEAVAKTKAIDLWLLFPLGIGVSRLLTRSGEIPKGWRARLDVLLGTTDWYDEFYKVEHRSDLLDGRTWDEMPTISAGIATSGPRTRSLPVVM